MVGKMRVVILDLSSIISPKQDAGLYFKSFPSSSSFVENNQSNNIDTNTDNMTAMMSLRRRSNGDEYEEYEEGCGEEGGGDEVDIISIMTSLCSHHRNVVMLVTGKTCGYVDEVRL